MIKVVIFDWGRTLYDSEHGALFAETRRVLETLARKYQLAIVPLASQGNFAERYRILREADIEKYFVSILFAQADKDSLYEQTLARLNVSAREVVIVDDRVHRGIAWGHRHGAMTIWLRKGKFSNEPPDDEMGMPTHIIDNLEEVCSLLYSSL